jgi:hypothetical protein
MEKEWFRENELAMLAKAAREKSGKTMAEVARMLKVSRSVIYNAENVPKRSLTKVRCQMIERLTERSLEGPFFRLK